MAQLDNINEYIARAAVLKKDLETLETVKEKFASLTYLFPSLEDKMICKAIFDTMYTSEVKSRKFIKNMVDAINTMVPKNISEMIDVYNQTSVLINEKIKKKERLISDDGGEISTQQEKQGTFEYDDKQSKNNNSFNVMPANEFAENRTKEKKKIKDKSSSIVSTVSSEDIKSEKQKTTQEVVDKLKKEEEARKRAAYEKSLAERRQKKQFASSALDLQKIHSKFDD